jgi:DNA-binding transcriptional MerR regulator
VFSTATQISIKALRLYHEQGLLIPAAIDPSTGYRSYRISQIADAQVIRRLRDLDMPLASVTEIVRARDPEVTRRIIGQHEQALRARLDDLARQVDEAQRAVAHPGPQTPVFVRDEPAHHVLAVEGLVHEPGHATYAHFLGSAFDRLYACIPRLGVTPTGPGGALYPPRIEGDPELVTAFVPIDAPVALDAEALAAGVVNVMLPAARCAVLTHAGPYQTMEDTYGPLAAWVVTHAEPADAPVRELYVVSVDEATGQFLPEEQFRTEIAWPLVVGSTTDGSSAR